MALRPALTSGLPFTACGIDRSRELPRGNRDCASNSIILVRDSIQIQVIGNTLYPVYCENEDPLTVYSLSRLCRAKKRSLSFESGKADLSAVGSIGESMAAAQP